jgi:hypothetical protein
MTQLTSLIGVRGYCELFLPHQSLLFALLYDCYGECCGFFTLTLTTMPYLMRNIAKYSASVHCACKARSLSQHISQSHISYPQNSRNCTADPIKLSYSTSPLTYEQHNRLLLISTTQPRNRWHRGNFTFKSCSHIKVRISVYFQSFSCIGILLFRNADHLVRSSFRNSMLSMYAIGIAFFIAQGSQSYSLQSKLVCHCFIDILLLSAFALMCFRPNLRKLRYYIILVGGVPFAISTLVIAANHESVCYDDMQFKSVNINSHTYHLYTLFWIVSAVLYALTVPLLILIALPKLSDTYRHTLEYLATFLWFLASVSNVVVGELIMGTAYFMSPDNQLTHLQTMEWSFGQVIAVVMLFFIIWDMAIDSLETSSHSDDIQLRYWWNTSAKPFYRRLRKDFGIGKLLFLSIK